MFAWIMMIAVLQSAGDYATFSETFGDEASCRAQIVIAEKIDIKQHDSNAEFVYAECVKVKARDPIGMNGG